MTVRPPPPEPAPPGRPPTVPTMSARGVGHSGSPRQDAPAGPSRPRSRARALPSVARNTWRGLTNMRTALILLFLLALASLPGALLPQRTPSPNSVRDFLIRNPRLGPALDRVGLFDVFATPWFSAVYLLLFISLVGCLLPRTLEQARALRAEPVAVPRNPARLPHYAEFSTDARPGDMIAAVRRRLAGRWGRGWKVVVRGETDGVATISAEKGALREVGNLVFHFSLIALLAALAVGKLFGYEGQVIVMADGSEFCNSGIYAYDSFRPGLQVDGTDLDPFCITVDNFRATYLPTGQPNSFDAAIRYQDAAAVEAGGGSPDAGAWQRHDLAVNDPLRIDGARVYLLGHGYAPRFTVTFPDGQQRTGLVQWRPVDQSTLLSEGATKIDPPGVVDEAQRRRSQLAITGILAPTSSGGGLVTSTFPALDNPEVAVDVLRGDLGLDSGRSQSIFEVDRNMVAQGRLTRVARENMTPGRSITLDDGTRIRFDDVVQWASLQVSNDPSQAVVLAAAIALLGGLTLSLTIKRRRFWVRATPPPAGARVGRTFVQLGGLARTDQAGYGDEFTRLTRDLGAADSVETTDPRTAPRGDDPDPADDDRAPGQEGPDPEADHPSGPGAGTRPTGPKP